MLNNETYASDFTLLDLFKHMIEQEIDVVNVDFEYEDLQLRIECKLTEREGE